MWDWIIPAKCRAICNESRKKELMIHLAVDFRIIWGTRTKKTSASSGSQVSHLWQNACKERDCWMYWFTNMNFPIWQSSVDREGDHKGGMASILQQQEKRPLHHDFRTTGAAACPQQSRGPDHVHMLQNGFFPPPSWSTSRYSLAIAVFLLFRIC